MSTLSTSTLSTRTTFPPRTPIAVLHIGYEFEGLALKLLAFADFLVWRLSFLTFIQLTDLG